MKSNILSALTICLLSALVFGVSHAQSRLLDGNAGIDADPVTIPHVTVKVDRAFIGYFKNASNLRWYEIKGKFMTKFTMNGHEHRALFTRNGNLVYHITYGTERLLPQDVRRIVKSEYYDQKITRVLKVNQAQRTIWVVHMENEKEFIMARVEDGELEETKRMEK